MAFDDVMNPVPEPEATTTVNRRTDADYEIEAVSKARLIFEALEEGPIRRSRIEKITGFNRDLVMRTLRTWRLGGWVVENDRGEWSYGPRFVRLALNSRSA